MFGYRVSPHQNMGNGFVRDFRGMFNVSGGDVGAALLPKSYYAASPELSLPLTLQTLYHAG